MNIRRVLAIAGIPFTIGACFVAPSQANAAHLSNQIAQISQNSPDDGPRRPDDKPQNKHRRPRPHQKKRLPQPPIDRPDQPPRDRSE